MDSKQALIEKLVSRIQMDTRDEISLVIEAAKEMIDIITSGRPFEFYGIQEAGLNAKAWSLVRYGIEFEDARQSILVEAVQLVRDGDRAVAEGGAYLLQKATWAAINTIKAQEHTYMRQAHDVQIDSADELDKCGESKLDGLEAPVVDFEMKVSVRQVISRMEPEDALIAEHLMYGYSKSEIASLTGVSRAAVSYRVKRIQVALEEVLV